MPQVMGSAPLRVVTDDDAVAADLSVPVLLREVQAEVPGAVGVGGSVLPGSGGADDIVAGHEVSFVCPLIIPGPDPQAETLCQWFDRHRG